MKYRFSLYFLFILNASCLSQNGEFGKLNDGLIYPDSTIQQLKFIVDSLNLKFKVCDLNKSYQSKLQAKANFIFLDSGDIKEAKRDIEAYIPFDEFTKKYRKADIENDLLVIKYTYQNYEDKDEIEFSSVELNNKYGHELSFDSNLFKYEKSLLGKWVYVYQPKTEYTDESIEAFYFTNEFTWQPIPEVYARMIQYSDCMVDTSTKVFYDQAQRDSRFSHDESYKVSNFLNYVHEATGRPEYNKNNYNKKKMDAYWEKYQLWDSLRLSKVDDLQARDETFASLFNDALAEAINKGGSNDEFEEYVGRYYSKKTELDLKRHRIVIGGCSQDMSPRIHALNIAKLSAETVNWEIFLRSHLDMMNDRFERVSDGSYALAGRKTYIKELEVLDIDVLDLILGISLRIENPCSNHYYGSIGRLGRALSETAHPDIIEAKMLQMISDKQLDDFNRVLIYYLFLNYNYNLNNKEKQAMNKEKLMSAVQTLPDYLAAKIIVE